MNTLVIDVQRSSLHDGPGIRTTVFLKGCPLRCQWCHNPESQSYEKQLSFQSTLCIGCKACEKVCPNQVHSFLETGQHEVMIDQCMQCNTCVDVCPTNALTVVGKDMTVEEVFKTVKKDRIFYEMSSGGVTISGGEPLTHPVFVKELLSLCKVEGIHTCIETCGNVRRENFMEILSLTDLYLFDYKVSIKEQAEEYLKGDFNLILSNLKFLLENNKQVILRCPIIPSVNDNEQHFDAIAELVKQYDSIIYAELLPYHDYGVVKSINTFCPQKKFHTPSDHDKEAWMNYFRKLGITERVKIAR